MTKTVLLDAGPLGFLCTPPRNRDAQMCCQWLANLIAVGVRAIFPEIADYEVRRELLRAGKTASIQRLNALAQAKEYLPFGTSIEG